MFLFLSNLTCDFFRLNKIKPVTQNKHLGKCICINSNKLVLFGFACVDLIFFNVAPQAILSCVFKKKKGNRESKMGQYSVLKG